MTGGPTKSQSMPKTPACMCSTATPSSRSVCTSRHRRPSCLSCRPRGAVSCLPATGCSPKASRLFATHRWPQVRFSCLHFSAERREEEGGGGRRWRGGSFRLSALQDKVFVVFYRTQRTLPRFRLPVIVENQQPLQLLPSCNVVLWTKPQDAAAFFNNLRKKASERAAFPDSPPGEEAPLTTATKPGERSRSLGWIVECKRGIRLWILLLIMCACGLGTYAVWRLSILWRRQHK